MQTPSRLRKAEEIIELAMMFQNSYCGLCIDDIKEHFECSRRSAERMKALLFDLFPDKIEEVPTTDRTRKWRFIKGTMNSLITFNADDFATLEQLKNLCVDNNKKFQLDEIIAKIKALTPQKNLRTLETDIEAIIESEGFAVRQHSTVKVNKKLLENIRLAMISYKKVQFFYEIDNELKQITINPYGLIFADKYYLVGYNDYVKDIRQYRVDKIKDFNILDEYFEQDEKFSLKEYSAKSFGVYQEEPINITLEFNKEVTQDVLNYHFHPYQKIKELDNGNVQVNITCGGTYAICQELFKWGCSVKIKKPTFFREYYKKYLSDVLKNQ